MAPTRGARSSTTVHATNSLPLLGRKGITNSIAFVPRAQNTQENDPVGTRSKRKADVSPLKNDKIKRSALGNLTNNVINLHLDDDKNNKKSTTSATTVHENDVHSKKDVNLLRTKSENTMVGVHQQQPQFKKTGIVLRNTKIVTRAVAAKQTSQQKEISCTANGSVVPLSAIHNHLKKYEQQIKAKECYELMQQQKLNHQKDLHAKKNTSHIQEQKHQQQKQQPHANIKNANLDPPKYIPSRRVSLDAKTRRISNEFEKTEDTLYMSALEEFPLSGESVSRLSLDNNKRKSLIDKKPNEVEQKCKNRILTPSPLKQAEHLVPDGVQDFDKENWDDPFQVSHYAMDIFNYMRRREVFFPIDNYMERQVHLTKWMRSLLIDWMVEVQETFELNHETLYLAVKLVDLYLTKVIVQKDKLQLLGAASLFIACKYDERTPPLVDDFLYICDGAYVHKELIRMEMSVLKTIDFDLSIPLSYRFLRRYARTAKIPMPTLTLARYILEFSLMDYSTVSLSDSQLACAVLFMALKMKNSQLTESPWSKTLEYYCGYKISDFGYIIPILNAGLKRKPKDAIKTIRNKYSHKIFFEVSKIPLLTNEKLFENTGLLGEDQNISEIDNNSKVL